MSRFRLKVPMFGSRIGTICKTDNTFLYLPTSSVKFTKGKSVIWWNVRVPLEVVDDFDEYFEKISKNTLESE